MWLKAVVSTCATEIYHTVLIRQAIDLRIFAIMSTSQGTFLCKVVPYHGTMKCDNLETTFVGASLIWNGCQRMQ